jgi:DNA modification methylase
MMTNPYNLHLGDNLATLKNYPDNTFDSIITDPPYGIAFLGKDWDQHTGTLELYKECLRVLKPGGYMLAFSAARTYHQLASNIELAGFEIRDQLMWLYSSGFPKAQDIGKAIQKRLGVEQEDVRLLKQYGGIQNESKNRESNANDTDETLGLERHSTITQPVCTSPLAKQWEGFKTALKPAMEPVVLARKSCGVERTLISNSVDETTLQMEALCSYVNNVVTQYSGSERNTAQQSAMVMLSQHQQDATQAANMSALLEIEETILNIVQLWSSTSVALLQVESMSTTETATSITTLLTTLRYSLSKSIQESIIPALISQDGKQSAAESVLKSLKDALLKLKDTHTECIALVNATNKKHTLSLAATAKPAHEPIVMARKPYKGSTIDNVLKNGLGAMNIDATRVPWGEQGAFKPQQSAGNISKFCDHQGYVPADEDTPIIEPHNAGRYPSNVIGEVAEGYQKYFYCPKVSRKERHSGFDIGDQRICSEDDQTRGTQADHSTKPQIGNNHPTVKPVALMEYLIKLVTPPSTPELQRKVLDPFMGSGSTGMAAVKLGHHFTGCELDPKYVAIAATRIESWNNSGLSKELFGE